MLFKYYSDEKHFGIQPDKICFIEYTKKSPFIDKNIKYIMMIVKIIYWKHKLMKVNAYVNVNKFKFLYMICVFQI